MARKLRPKRGTTAQNNAYTGALGEITIDTDKKTLVVHDGVTAGGNPSPNDFIDLQDVPSSYSGQALKGVRVNAGANALEFYTPAAGMTPGDLVILVPTDAANFTAALNIAKASAYSGRITIRFEAGYILTEPLWFDGVQMPNLDIDFSPASPMSVNTTTFPTLIAGAYRVVFGGQNSKIGRVYGTATVTAGDGPDLLAVAGINFDYTNGINNYLGASTALSITGTSFGILFAGSNVRGEGTLTVPSSATGRLQIYGSTVVNLPLSFGGGFIEVGSISGVVGESPSQVTFDSVTLTGAVCEIVAIGGHCDFGRFSPAALMNVTIAGSEGAYVRGTMNLGSIAPTADYFVSSTSGADVLITATGNTTWRPASTGSVIVKSEGDGSSRAAFHNISGTLTVDNALATPNYLASATDGGEAWLKVSAIAGSYGTASATAPNSFVPYNSGGGGGTLVRVTGVPGYDRWTALTLLNSWVNIVGAQAAQYRMIGDMVQVRMAIEDGTASTLFTLPAGFRPPATIGVPAQVHDNTDAPDFGHLRIEADGDVILEHPGVLANHQVWATFEFSTTA